MSLITFIDIVDKKIPLSFVISSWQWVYLVLVPIVALGLIGAKLFLKETAERSTQSPLDLLGVLMGSGSVFLLVLGTLQGRSWGWASPLTIGCFFGAIILLPLFLVRSSNHPEPLRPAGRRVSPVNAHGQAQRALAGGPREPGRG